MADAYDSDDSGFDDDLSSDEVLLGRIAQMRSMMTLTTDAAAAPSPPEKPTTAPTTAPTPPPQPSAPTMTEADSAAAAERDGEDGEFLIVDSVHALALSEPAETEVEAPAETQAVEMSAPPPADQQEQEEEQEEDEEDDGYTVTWPHGQLGLLFKASDRGETLIRRVNKKVSSAEGLHFARVGDVLVSINGASVRGRAFQDVVEQLRLPAFPVTLYFQPLVLSDDDDADADDDGHVYAQQQQQQHHHHDHSHAAPTQMDRKESSLSAISSSSSAGAVLPPYSASMGALPSDRSGLERSPSYRLNQLAASHGMAVPSSSVSSSVPPPPAYHSEPGASFDDANAPPGEYDVVWRQGALGCGIKQRHGIPTIKSVTPGAAVDPSVKQIGIGDVMVSINGLDTDVIGFRAVVETMQRAPKPIFMRFRRVASGPSQSQSQSFSQSRPTSFDSSDMFRPSRDSGELSRPWSDDEATMYGEREPEAGGPLAPGQYTVLWTDGPLGVQIKPRAGDGAVVVSKFTGTGDPELLANLRVGDMFVRIAGTNVADIGISGTYERLKNVQKPVVLVFERSVPLPFAPPTPPPAAAAPPLLAGREGFPVVDEPRDTAAVPSFRELRERQAVQQHQDHPYRESFAGFTPEQRGDAIFGAANRRAAHAKQRPASYDALEHFGEHRSDGRPSFAKTDHSDSDARFFPDRASDPSRGSGGGDDAAFFLPRFSDIETGRVETMAVSALPPPPAYHDTFSQSGRALHPRLFTGSPQKKTTSPERGGDERRTGGSSIASSGHGNGGGGRPPPVPHQAYGYDYDYDYGYGYGPRDTPSPSPSPPPPPPPPSYEQLVGGGGANANHAPRGIDRLRQQYIEAERLRNQRDETMTEVSSYSDLDDSGVMAAMRRGHDDAPPPPAYDRFVSPPPHPSMGGGGGGHHLPTPELWIQWSEGPLGITFRRTNGQIVVSRLTGAGYSRGLEQLRAGDWLVSFGNAGVGSYATSELRLAETMELIKRLPKPVSMCFVVR